MQHMVRRLVCLATVAGLGFGAMAYEDEFISVDDGTVVKTEVDGHAVYVFATPTELARKLTLLQPMVLDQYLVVGGGGAGGVTVGGGGGGGGVVYEGAAGISIGSGVVLGVQVGAGGASSGANGKQTTLALSTSAPIIAYGGGGGAGYNAAGGANGASSGGASSSKGAAVPAILAVDPPQGNLGGAGFAGIKGENAVAGGGGGYSEPGEKAYLAYRDVMDGETLIKDQPYNHGGKGGRGFACSITGEEHVYGSGGGGAAGWASHFADAKWWLPGEGGEESGGRGGHTVLNTHEDVCPVHGNLDLCGVAGVDGLGGGGGGGGHNNKSGWKTDAGKGGCGTVILALRTRTAADRALAIAPIADIVFEEGGDPVEPDLTVTETLSGATLTKDVDYSVTYADNAAYGTATAMVVGTNDYAGLLANAEFRLRRPRTSNRKAVLLLGGANMIGFAADNGCTRIDLSDIDVFDGQVWSSGTLSEPLFKNVSKAGIGPGTTFARIVKSANPSVQVGILPFAVNASTMASWKPSGANYQAMAGQVRGVLEDGSEIVAVLWHQGEADLLDGAALASYAEDFAEMVQALRADLGLGVSVPVIVGTVGNFTGAGDNCIEPIRGLNKTLRGLPSTVPGCLCVDTSDLVSNPDKTTFTASSVRTLGQRYAEAYLSYRAACAGSQFTVDAIGPQALAGGDPVEPAVTVRTNGAPVDASLYDVAYSATNATGFGIATVTGRGRFAGSTNAVPFRILKPVFVTQEGTAENDGASWATATTFERAVELAGTTNEVWMKAGRHVRTAVYKMTHAMTVRGGFAGVSGALAAEDPVSDFDGEKASDLMTSDNLDDYNFHTLFERCGFVRSRSRGLTRQGRGRAQFVKCRFNCNGAGLGLNCSGSSGQKSMEVLIRDCEFRGNLEPDATWMTSGSGAALSYVSFAFVENSLFVSNGVPFTHAYPSGTLHGHGWGLGVCADAVGGVDVTGCRFAGNRGTASTAENGSSVIYLNTYNSFVTNVIRNCVFVGNEMIGRGVSGQYWGTGVRSGMICSYSANARSLIDNCTFAYNLVDAPKAAAGVTVALGRAKIRNSIFYGNFVSDRTTVGADVFVADGAYAEVDHSLFRENTRSYLSAENDLQLVKTGIVTGDPLFATAEESVTNALVSKAKSPLVDWPKVSSNFGFDAERLEDLIAIDVHLKSAAGYRTNAGEWMKAPGALSAAIDAGNPGTDYLNEPEPNGGCVNLGAYGNTAEASMTPESEPIIDGDVVVEYPGEYAQPKVSVTLGDAKGGSYNGTVTISVGRGGVWTSTGSVSGACGETVSVLAMDWYPSGAVLDVQVVLEVSGKGPVEKTIQVTVPADKGLPPFYGKGGGANVIHVRPGATGRNDGTSWQDAYDCDLHTAIFNYLTSARPEIWYAGPTNLLKGAVATWVPSFKTVFRGGFTGSENSPAERRPKSITVIDAGFKYTAMSVASTVDLVFDGFAFAHGNSQGFYCCPAGAGSNSGSMTFTNCQFVANGQETKGDVQGRAGYFHGLFSNAARTDTTAYLTFTDCLFEDNYCQTNKNDNSNWDGGIGGLWLRHWARVTLDNCVFRNNGLRFDHVYSACGSTSRPAAIRAELAPVTARNCTFVGHRNCTGNAVGNSGVVTLLGRCGGSAFTNCLFASNTQFWWSNCRTCNYGAPLMIATDDTNTPVEVVNTTFFGNIVNGSALSAGINVVSGRLDLKNSVFAENRLGRHEGVAAADLTVKTNAVANVSYTLFSDESAVTNGIGGTLDLGEGVLFGPARTVTTPEEVAALVTSCDGGNPLMYDLTRADEACSFNVHLRGRSGYRDEKTGEIVRLAPNSPAIDRGDPAVKCVEPKPNGHRVNMGFYGNTPWATMSKGGTLIFVR